MRFLFLGEKPSDKAIAMGVIWEDGCLAAKQLFDALVVNGIEPGQHRFQNVFETAVGYVERKDLLKILRDAGGRGQIVVAMGQRVSRCLKKLGWSHLAIVHPAARGKIRLKATYARHVGEALKRVV